MPGHPIGVALQEDANPAIPIRVCTFFRQSQLVAKASTGKPAEAHKSYVAINNAVRPFIPMSGGGRDWRRARAIRRVRVASARRVWFWFRDQGLSFPLRVHGGPSILWVAPTYIAIHSILSNPVYAGAHA
jgi:hypothetical protein